MFGTIGGDELAEVWERAKRLPEPPYGRDKMCEVCSERVAMASVSGLYVCNALSCNRDAGYYSRKRAK